MHTELNSAPLGGPAPLTTLVLGGYGNFGTRICRALAHDPAIALLVGGRDAAKAAALAEELAQTLAQTLGQTQDQTLRHRPQGLAIDHSQGDFSNRLRQLGVGLVIHTAGPFQQQDYGVARATAAAGAHYIDLADGRRFVCDFAAATDAAFCAAGTMAVCGASTVPALSSAVVDHLCRGWQHIDSIDTCIAPAQTAPRGKATLEAVLGYCGGPIAVWEQGAWQTQFGWTRPQPVQFARLAPRKGALCDIPDLELFVAHYRVRQRVSFRAALEVPSAQQAFAGLAYLRRKGVLRHPERWAGFLNFCAPVMDRLGSALGGMVVLVQGADAQGHPTRRAWHIAADNDHGPEIPCMAAILLAQQTALRHGNPSSQAPQPVGAMACTGLLALEAFAPLFVHWGMATDVVDEDTSHGP